MFCNPTKPKRCAKESHIHSYYVRFGKQIVCSSLEFGAVASEWKRKLARGSYVVVSSCPYSYHLPLNAQGSLTY